MFSSSGNHLVAHAYQVLSPQSAFDRLPALLFCRNVCVMMCLSKNTQAQLLISLHTASSGGLCCRDVECVGTTVMGVMGVMGRGGGIIAKPSCGLCDKLQWERVSTFFPRQELNHTFFPPPSRSSPRFLPSVTIKHNGTVTGIPSPVIPRWPLLRLSAIPTNNTTQ